jgi:ribosome biogenesis GTPase A
MLCDCPGLVFPSFMRSTGEMLCAGVLAVNQMRDHAEPAEVVVARVTRRLLESVYSLRIERQVGSVAHLSIHTYRLATRHIPRSAVLLCLPS